MTLSLLYNTIWSPLCDTEGTIREWLLWMDVPNWRLEDILHFKYLLQNDDAIIYTLLGNTFVKQYQARLYAVNTPIAFTAAGLRY